MAVVELTCMAPGKDAGDGKKRCKGPLSRRDGGARGGCGVLGCRGRKGTSRASTIWAVPGRSTLPDRPVAGDGDSMAHAADAEGCLSRVAWAAEAVRVAEAAALIVLRAGHTSLPLLLLLHGHGRGRGHRHGHIVALRASGASSYRHTLRRTACGSRLLLTLPATPRRHLRAPLSTIHLPLAPTDCSD